MFFSPTPPTREQNRSAAKKATIWLLGSLAVLALITFLTYITNGIALLVLGIGGFLFLAWQSLYDEFRHDKGSL